MSTSLTSKRVVLLVEDDEPLRAALVDALKLLGYRVHEAENGTVALDVAAVVQEPIDLVISDYVMPGISGLELYEALRSGGYAGKFLIITGYSIPKAVQSDAAYAGVVWSKKPISVSRLRRTLARILEE